MKTIEVSDFYYRAYCSIDVKKRKGWEHGLWHLWGAFGDYESGKHSGYFQSWATGVEFKHEMLNEDRRNEGGASFRWAALFILNVYNPTSKEWPKFDFFTAALLIDQRGRDAIRGWLADPWFA